MLPFAQTLCSVCSVTAGGKAYLRSLSIAKLKNYIQAYGLRLGADVIEKDDVIDAIVSARVRSMADQDLVNCLLTIVQAAKWLSSPTS